MSIRFFRCDVNDVPSTINFGEKEIPESWWFARVEFIYSLKGRRTEGTEPAVEHYEFDPCGGNEGCKIIGIDPDKVEKYLVKFVAQPDGRQDRTYLFVAPEPFGIIVPKWGYDHWFEVAEQWYRKKIENDEWGYGWEPAMRKPPIAKPEFVRGAKNWRWIKISDLAKFLGLPAEQMWLDYFLPANHRKGPLPAWERTIYVTVGNPNSKPVLYNIAGPFPEDYYEKLTLAMHDFWSEPIFWEEELDGPRPQREPEPEPASEEKKVQVDFENTFVPSGWAMNVLYLHHFGYKPKQAEAAAV